jgi:glycine/D-amino acid oxidase-like deaminating enzyme
MKWVSAESFWRKHTKIPKQFPYLTEDISTEVVIVGGGITGALTAYYFTKAGINTVLVDKNIIAYNSTSVSPSILQYGIDSTFAGLTKQYGEDNAATAFQLCLDAVYEIKLLSEKMQVPCGFEEVPCLSFTSDLNEKKQLQAEFELRQKHGFPVQFLDKQEAQATFSLPLEAGILSTGGAAQIDPYRFTHGLLQLAIRQGLHVFEQTEIVKRSPQTDHIVLKTNNHFQLTAQKVIFATGYEAQAHIHEKIAQFTRSFSIVTRPHFDIEGWYEKAIIRDNKIPYTYLRSLPDQRILISGCNLPINSEKDKIANLLDDDPQTEEAYDKLFKQLIDWFPKARLIPQDIEYRFHGIFAGTKDSLPYIGECESMPQCYLNLGYGTNGILYALMGAKILLEMYQGKTVPYAHLFRFGR